MEFTIAIWSFFFSGASRTIRDNFIARHYFGAASVVSKWHRAQPESLREHGSLLWLEDSDFI
jgi:hypothetical protein